MAFNPERAVDAYDHHCAVFYFIVGGGDENVVVRYAKLTEISACDFQRETIAVLQEGMV